MGKVSFLSLILMFISLSKIFSATVMPTPTFSPTPGGWCSLLNLPVVEGTVCAITATANSVYVGGSFSCVGPRTGRGMPVNATTGVIIPGFPQIAGVAVVVAISDGSGGWFVGGDFEYVNGEIRNNIAHIFANGSLDPIFNPDANQTVYELCLYNGSIYAGGSFSVIGGQTRSCLAKLDPVTGAVDTSFDAQILGRVLAIFGEGTNIVAAGWFTNVAGQSRGHAAKLNASTGALDPQFNPYADGNITDIATDGTNYYIAGSFNSVGVAPLTRYNVAKVNGITGAVDPVFNAGYVDFLGVQLIACDATGVYVGGQFTTLGTSTQRGLAKLNAVTGAPDTTFTPGVNNSVFTFNLTGSSLYIGGAFTSVGSNAMRYAAKVDKSTGALDTSFNPKPGSFLYGIGYDGSTVYLGGSFASLNVIDRSMLFKMNTATGQVDAGFNGNVGSKVNTICLAGNYIYIGGAFTSPGMRLAKLDASTGAVVSSFAVSSLSGVGAVEIDALAFDGANLFVGGDLTSINGVNRNYVAKVDGNTAAVDTIFNPGATGSVASLLLNSGNLYIGSAGITQLRKVDAVTGVVDPLFIPGTVSMPYSMSADAGSLYNGGTANKMDKITGVSVPGFNVSYYYSVFSVALKTTGDGFFLGGMFTKTSSPLNYIAKVSAAYGYTDFAFQPEVDSYLNAIDLSPAEDVIYLGGLFNTVNKMPLRGFAGIVLAHPPTQTLTTVCSPTVTRTITMTRTATKTITATKTQTSSPTESYTITETPTITETCTDTETHTVSPTVSETSTVTDTYTITETETITETATVTATGTDTATITYTPTNSYTCTPSLTCTNSPVFSPTATVTNTPQNGNAFLYPNPANTSITISFESNMGAQQAEISIYTVGFRLIRKAVLSSNAQNIYSINVSDIANGTYVVVAKLIKDGNVVFRKVNPIIIIK